MNMKAFEALRAWLIAPILAEIRKVENQVSELSDAIAAVSTGLSDVSAKLTQLGLDLLTEIQAINDKIVAGAVTQEDLANLNTIAAGLGTVSSGLQSLSDQVKAIVP